MRSQSALPLLLLGAAALLVLAARADRLREHGARTSVRPRELGSTRGAELMVRAGALRLAARRDERWELPQLPPFGVPPGSELGGCGPAEYGPPGAPWPSTVLGAAQARGARVPVLSLAIEGCRLRHLVERPYQKGRAFEEPAFLTWFDGGTGFDGSTGSDGGRVRFESGVGLRLHGGRKRHAHRKSFRFYFRDEFGLPALPSGVLDTGTSPPAVVVAELAEGRDGGKRIWHFVNALGFDVARRIGLPAPAATPVDFVLNGRAQGPYLLVERIDDDYLRRHFGHRDFDLVRPKSTNTDGESAALRATVEAWARTLEPFSAAALEDEVDLDNLTRWLVLVTYAATSDAFQAPALRDRRAAAPRWFWVAWDLEMSFRTASARPDHGWQKNVLRQVLRERREVHTFALILAQRLLREDPAFRARYLAALSHTLNHRLTTVFLAERLAHYRELAERFALPEAERLFLDELGRFFVLRPAHLFADVERELGARAHTLTVAGPADVAVEVDGERVALPWAGIFFTGQPVRLRGDATVSLATGKETPARELVLQLTSELTVRATTR